MDRSREIIRASGINATGGAISSPSVARILLPSSRKLRRFLGRHFEGFALRGEAQNLRAVNFVGSFCLALVTVSTSPDTVHKP